MIACFVSVGKLILDQESCCSWQRWFWPI